MSLRDSITKILKGAMESFSRFPVSIISAIIISIVAIIRISMGWEKQKTYNLLFDSIQLSFLLGAVFSMAAVAYEEIEPDKKEGIFQFSNIAGIILAVISFLLLYFFGGLAPDDGIVYLSNISIARISAAIFISAVAFVYIISKSKTIDNFSDGFFISHKAFVISAIYGIVTMIGVSGVLGAFQALVYNEMSFKVYQYLGVGVGFLTYTIFLGYFPSFSQTEKTDKIKRAEEQPRFIFVLFSYILVPIMLALTVVLLIWSIRVLMSGVDVSFTQLSSIASSYVIAGIWLHIMVSKHKTKAAKFYKIAYPFSAILVLAFEAWALIDQLGKFGIRTVEYSFIMIWVFGAISVILIIFARDRAYRDIAILAMVISIIGVMPEIGYQDITFNSQIERLEEILTQEDMLVNDEIVKKESVERKEKAQITEAVDFIANSEKTDLPSWFKEDLIKGEIFKETFGFSKTYGIDEDLNEYRGINLRLGNEAIDISDYTLSLKLDRNRNKESAISFKNDKGEYKFYVDYMDSGIPQITVKRDEKIIIKESLENYLHALTLKYPLDSGRRMEEIPLGDMTTIIEGEGISMLVVFENIDIYNASEEDYTDYYVNIRGIYVKYQ